MQGYPHVGAVGPPRFLVRGWRVAALPSRRVIPMSGLGDPFDALCADGRRPLPPWWVIRMSGLRVPLDGLCLDGGLPLPSGWVIRMSGLGDPLAALPGHTHCGVNPGTARAKRKERTPIQRLIVLGGIALRR